jgi:putative transposase
VNAVPASAHVAGGTYFFTVNLRDRSRGLLVDYIDDLRASFRDVRRKFPFRIDAVVVLPEHLHCVWTLPPGDADFSTRWRLIKTRFMRAIPRGDVWQRRFWEHSIGNERDLIAHLDYIHFNPVKHRHVTRPIDWPYSSFHRFVATGMYSADWTASPAVQAWNRE